MLNLIGVGLCLPLSVQNYFLFSPFGKLAGRAIYFADVFFFIFYYFFNDRLLDPVAVMLEN